MANANGLSWGPLSTPIHNEDITDPALPPWKDNVYIAFWNTDEDIYGTYHVSTSPNNVEGRRVRFSFYAKGPNVEIIESIDRGTLSGETVFFDLAAGVVTLKHPRLTGTVRFSPGSAYADFCSKALPTLVDKPLKHYQIGVEAEGNLTLDGKDISFSAQGIRDRSWGFREMSLNMPEYIWLYAIFPDYQLTAMRFIDIDGADRSDGYKLTDDAADRVITGIFVTRDPSGLFAAGDLTCADNSQISMRSQGRRAGFWLPMEWERKGPSMSAYDEFCVLERDDGVLGQGVVEHGNIRNLY